jgi:ligand-binding sensor domain-containing protein
MAVGPGGRVWFGGDEGLRHTAGTEGGALGPPLVLPPERPEAVLALAAGPDGLWIGQAHGGACRVAWTEEATLACEATVDILPGVEARLTALAVDAGGRLWMATAGQGLYRRDGDGAVTAIAPGARGTPAEGFVDLEADPDGALWAVGGGVLYRLYDGGERVEALGTATGLLALGAVRGVSVSAGEDGGVAIFVAAARGIGFRLRR